MKANATRFTVWPLWPLRYSPLAYFDPACIPLNKTCIFNDDYERNRSVYSQKLAEGLEPTTTGLQNRSSAN